MEEEGGGFEESSDGRRKGHSTNGASLASWAEEASLSSSSTIVGVARGDLAGMASRILTFLAKLDTPGCGRGCDTAWETSQRGGKKGRETANEASPPQHHVGMSDPCGVLGRVWHARHQYHVALIRH